jgi:hypothetical protein
VNEYLEMHQAAPVTITKLRWVLGKPIAELGEKRLADLSPRDLYAWRMTIPVTVVRDADLSVTVEDVIASGDRALTTPDGR